MLEVIALISFLVLGIILLVAGLRFLYSEKFYKNNAENTEHLEFMRFYHPEWEEAKRNELIAGILGRVFFAIGGMIILIIVFAVVGA